MTTIPTLVPDETLMTIRQRADAHPVDWRRVGLALLAFIPLALGRAAGQLAWAASYMVAAFVEGFDAGRARPPAAETSAPVRRPRSAVVTRQE